MRYYLYRLATLVIPLLPTRFGYALFARLGDLAYYLAASSRQNYWNNLRHILGDQVRETEHRRLAHRAFQNLFKNYYDLFRNPALHADQIRAELASVTGAEHLYDELAKGHGAIVASAHIGNFDALLHMVIIHLKDKYRVVVPMERLKPEKLYELVRAMRASQGIEMIPVDQAARLLIKTLKSGQIVGLAIDRDITATGPILDFLGAPARLPDGGVQLALRYNVPLVIGFSVRRADNRSDITIEPAFYFENTGDTERDVRRGVERVAALLEKWVRAYPDQWLMFQPFWESDK